MNSNRKHTAEQMPFGVSLNMFAWKCSRKVRYETKREAKAAQKKYKHEYGLMNRYMCPFCGGYHLKKRPSPDVNLEERW